MNARNIQTIQQTSKIYKLQLILSALLACIGVVIPMATSSIEMQLVGAALIPIGLLWFISIRFLIWWNHA